MLNRVGRPTKLNKKVQESIVIFLRFGNHLETAAAFNGIDRTTMYRWIARGKQEKQRLEAVKGSKIRQSEVCYVEFCNVVCKANAEAEIRFVSIIYQAAKEYPRFAWKMLMSGRFPRWKNNGTQIIDSATEPTDENSHEDIDAIRTKLIRRLLILQGLPADAIECTGEEPV